MIAETTKNRDLNDNHVIWTIIAAEFVNCPQTRLRNLYFVTDILNAFRYSKCLGMPIYEKVLALIESKESSNNEEVAILIDELKEHDQTNDIVNRIILEAIKKNPTPSMPLIIQALKYENDLETDRNYSENLLNLFIEKYVPLSMKETADFLSFLIEKADKLGPLENKCFELIIAEIGKNPDVYLVKDGYSALLNFAQKFKIYNPVVNELLISQFSKVVEELYMEFKSSKIKLLYENLKNFLKLQGRLGNFTNKNLPIIIRMWETSKSPEFLLSFIHILSLKENFEPSIWRQI